MTHWKVYSRYNFKVNEFFEISERSGNPEALLAEDLSAHPEWVVIEVDRLDESLLELFYEVKE